MESQYNPFLMLRKQAGLSQRQLGEALNIPHSNICHIEKGQTASLALCKKYSEYFHVPIMGLLPLSESERMQEKGQFLSKVQSLAISSDPEDAALYENCSFLLNTTLGIAFLNCSERFMKSEVDIITFTLQMQFLRTCLENELEYPLWELQIILTEPPRMKAIICKY